jgi:hypothetical protein
MQLQLPSGEITRDFMQKLVETVNELTEARAQIASLQDELSDVKKQASENEEIVKVVGERDPMEMKWHDVCFPPVALVQITEAGTGGDAGKYKVKEVTYDSNIKADYAGGRVLANFTTAYAKEVNGRPDIPVGDVVPMFAYETPSGFNYVIGPFFSTGGGGGGGGLLVQLYTCEDVEEYGSVSCAIDASPLEAAVSTLAFSSGCQVGDVRWTGSDASEIKGAVWTLSVIENKNGFDTNPPAFPATTIKFSDGYAAGEVPDGQVVFTLAIDDETRSTNGAWCGGKIATITGTVQGFGLAVRWDPNPNTTDNQNPVKDIYLKDTANGGTLPNKTQGINFTVTKDPDSNGTDTKIKVEANATIPIGDLADVDPSATPAFLDTQYKYVYAWDDTNSKWVRLKQEEITVVTNVSWDTTTGELKQTKKTIYGFNKVSTGTDSTVDTAVACVA